MLALAYMIEGNLAGVRLPDPRPPRRADELWRHTCCEVFLAECGQTRYYECNFAPSLAWAIYHFTAYREGMSVVGNAKRPHMALRTRADRIELTVVINLDALSPLLASADLRLAVSTVIEEMDGRCSYWALRHPPGQPDFHHLDSFALTLDQVAPASGLTSQQD